MTKKIEHIIIKIGGIFGNRRQLSNKLRIDSILGETYIMLKAKNSSLNRAGVAKDDEFYTTYDAIQIELNHYEDKFRDKVVFCNCDDPFESNFTKFFLRNFNYLKLKRLICISYSGSMITGTQLSLFDNYNEPVESTRGYILDVSHVPMQNGRGVSDEDITRMLHQKGIVKRLSGNGDFRSKESLKYLKIADVVVTNPPFSKFREFIKQLMHYKKQFLVLGNTNIITYKQIFPLFKENKIWLGVSHGDMSFKVPDNYPPRKTRYWVDDSGQKWRSMGNIEWVTNLDYSQRHEDLILYKRYNSKDFPDYDNYKAINVSKVADIPIDYVGAIGVPVTFLDHYNPEQFDILGVTANGLVPDDLKLPWPKKHNNPFIKGESKYQRIIIKNKKVQKIED